MLLNGKEECNCRKKKCVRHGKCDECVGFHKANKREVYCMREKVKVELKNKQSINNAQKFASSPGMIFLIAIVAILITLLQIFLANTFGTIIILVGLVIYNIYAKHKKKGE
jgi:type IV secretory pathway TrbD component